VSTPSRRSVYTQTPHTRKQTNPKRRARRRRGRRGSLRRAARNASRANTQQATATGERAPQRGPADAAEHRVHTRDGRHRVQAEDVPARPRARIGNAAHARTPAMHRARRRGVGRRPVPARAGTGLPAAPVPPHGGRAAHGRASRQRAHAANEGEPGLAHRPATLTSTQTTRYTCTPSLPASAARRFRRRSCQSAAEGKGSDTPLLDALLEHAPQVRAVHSLQRWCLLAHAQTYATRHGKTCRARGAQTCSARRRCAPSRRHPAGLLTAD
jgi:hypothetical protein